ncbi:unnamed protein product [Prunus armeniaca]
MQEEIANKWRKLNPKEKAIYGSALEGSSGQVESSSRQVNDAVNDIGFTSRCSPDRFHPTVEKLSNEKRLAINDIGFGNVSFLSCTRLHRELCQFFIQRFNPDTSSIELHDNVFGISVIEFGRVMGLKNTGEDVELDSSIEDEKVKQLVKSFCGNGKRVLVRGLAEQLEMCENVDEDFKVRFVMFALGTTLPDIFTISDRELFNFLDDPREDRDQELGRSWIQLLILAPVIQAEVKQSVEELALGPIIQAEVQRSVLELTDKIMSQVSSFMKDARQHLHPGHEDVNQTKEDGPLKIQDEGGENVVKKKGEESSKLKEKGAVDVNDPWTPLPDGQTFSEPKLKIGVEKRKFTKLARGDQSGIQTRRTAERHPGLHCMSTTEPQVTAEAATELLELNAGLNVVLFSTALEASIEIRRLRQENEILKNTSGTTIASSNIGQHVLDDDAEHKSMKKMRKSKKNRKMKMKRRMKTKLGSKTGMRMPMRTRP